MLRVIRLRLGFVLHSLARLTHITVVTMSRSKTINGSACMVEEVASHGPVDAANNTAAVAIKTFGSTRIREKLITISL